jgi:glycine/D-amino acid oxidase-like deaminating enzyme/Rieske Fe-S protein
MKEEMSLWRSAPKFLNVQSPPQSGTYDVIIVGGGISGLSLAVELSQSGKNVALFEGVEIGNGTTGGTSAHLSSIPDYDLKKLISVCGLESGQMLLRELEHAIDIIESRAGAAAEFQRADAYLYTEANDTKFIEEQFEAAQQLKIDVARTRTVPLPFAVTDVIRFGRQGIFHPRLYLNELARQFVAAGGTLIENLRVTSFDTKNSKEGKIVHCGDKKFTCTDLVLATHTPIGREISLQGRMLAYLSYVIAIRLTGDHQMIENALYWDDHNPYHYIRLARDSEGPLVLIGGADHKVGERGERSPFEVLEQFAAERFAHFDVKFRWSAEFFDPADGLPYVGPTPFLNGVYTMTGYSGVGLTFGTLAARMIGDLILKRPKNAELHHLLRPSRINPISSVKNIADETMTTIKHFVADRFKADDVSAIDDLQIGEGVTVRADGKLVAVYRDSDGSYYAMSPICSHAGCVVKWNSASHSWDCPCHGSRFNGRGNVCEGPALKDLEPIELNREPDITEGAGVGLAT